MIKLREYQVKNGVQYLRKVNGRGCLYWEMRLGKTIVCIRYLSQRADAKRILVVGPYSVLPGWEETLIDEKKKVFLVTGNSKERTKFIYDNENVTGYFLINKESHLWVDILGVSWDAIIIDEGFISNPSAQVTKYFLKNTRAQCRIILTGTPAPENESQYYSQLQWINPKILGHKNFWDFRCVRFRSEGFEMVMPIRHRAWLAKRLQANCSVLKRKDVNLQKEKIYETRYVKLKGSTWKKYRQIEKDAMLDDEVLKYAGQRWNAMRRLCSQTEKMTELEDLLNGELKNKRVIVYAWYIEEVKGISEKFSCPAIFGDIPTKRREAIRQAFQAGKLNLIALQPETVKFGACFSQADAAIFYSRPSSLLTNQQVEERTEDLSTSDSTLIVDLVARDTIEEDILLSIKNKEGRIAALERLCCAIKNRNARAV